MNHSNKIKLIKSDKNHLIINQKLKILNKNITKEIDETFQKSIYLTNMKQMVSNAIARLLISNKDNVGATCCLNNDIDVLFSANYLIDIRKIKNLNLFLNDTEPIKSFTELIIEKLKFLQKESQRFCKNLMDKLLKVKEPLQNVIIIKQINKFSEEIDVLFKLNYLDEDFINKINDLITMLKNSGINDRPFLENMLKIFCKLDSVLFDYYLLTFSKKSSPLKTIQVTENDEEVHCEINLAFKLLNENKHNWSFIGVSKLCCPLCKKTLECLIGQSKKKINYSGSHDCYFSSKHDYRLPVESEKYPRFLECFNSWIDNAMKPNQIHKVNQICKCNQDPKKAYPIPHEISRFTETFDIYYFNLDDLNDEQKSFLESYPEVIKLIKRFNIIKEFHNSLFNQMDTTS